MDSWVDDCWYEYVHMHVGRDSGRYFRLLCSILFPEGPRKPHIPEDTEVQGYVNRLWGLNPSGGLGVAVGSGIRALPRVAPCRGVLRTRALWVGRGEWLP